MTDITLLQINDLHGYLEPHPELFELTPGAAWRSGGGLARIASLFRAIRRETGDAVIALDNGDTFHGSMPAVQTQGAALVRPMSKLGLDGMTVHWELAYGLRQVATLAKGLAYPFLAANVSGDGQSVFAPFTVVNRAGLRVGVWNPPTSGRRLRGLNTPLGGRRHETGASVVGSDTGILRS